jgi:hypothetical protein
LVQRRNIPPAFRLLIFRTKKANKSNRDAEANTLSSYSQNMNGNSGDQKQRHDNYEIHG